ncbi:MAG: sulfatase family protein [Anaerolineae bacterium]
MDRREFLKLLGALPLAYLLRNTPRRERGVQNATDLPNILILVFDTFSAKHASLHGYPRETTPNLSRFAERATVYHAHYAAGNFTNPGTASLLTGTYPWTHRALALFSSVLPPYHRRSLFATLASDKYYSLTYSHNLVASTLFYSFFEDIDHFKKTRDLCLLDHQLSDRLFLGDYDVAVWRERLFRGGENVRSLPSSPFYYFVNRKIWLERKKRIQEQYKERFPRGLPMHHEQIFLLEDAMAWLSEHLRTLPQPFLGYFHFSPPHYPYNAPSEFVGKFQDEGVLPSKPPHFFSDGHSEAVMRQKCREYDEYVAYVDREFGRLYDNLSRSGMLENTCLIVTSDHGEMFERGIIFHSTPTLYESIIRVPLLISWPGQERRVDVEMPTSAVDVLPTLLEAADQPIPTWCEGEVLPGFRETPVDEDRSVFAVEARSNPYDAPLQRVTLAMIKGRYKLIHYRGYPGYESEYELYDLVADPEELRDLYDPTWVTCRVLQDELEEKLYAVNQPYGGKG